MYSTDLKGCDMSPSTTLRTVNDLPTAPAVLAESTLILVDYQNTYTAGVMELEGWSPALDAAADLLARARAAGSTVVHVLHDGGLGTPYDVTAAIGQVHERVAPIAGEAVVVKNAPNAFVGTDLGDIVDAAGHADVVIAGFMTHMCVTFTAEGAFLRGNRPTVVAAASATRSLPGLEGAVAARDLHRAALATIGDLYAVVVPTTAELG
jgi:nicotinamidase-related amidase